jgi:hypothetical protein
MCHTVVLLLTFITFCVLNSIVSYDQSKGVIEVSAFDCRWAFFGEPKFSFNHDRHSTSCFKLFSSSQKVNSLISLARVPFSATYIYIFFRSDAWSTRNVTKQSTKSDIALSLGGIPESFVTISKQPQSSVQRFAANCDTSRCTTSSKDLISPESAQIKQKWKEKKIQTIQDEVSITHNPQNPIFYRVLAALLKNFIVDTSNARVPLSNWVVSQRYSSIEQQRRKQYIQTQRSVNQSNEEFVTFEVYEWVASSSRRRDPKSFC